MTAHPDDTPLLPLVAQLGRDLGDPDRARDDLARIVWSCLAEPGDAVAGMLIDAVGAADALLVARSTRPHRAAPEAAGISAADWASALQRWRPRMSSPDAEHALRIAAARGIRLLTPADETWPGAVDDLGPHRPICLWVRGDPAALMVPSAAVAVVGARAATGYGEHVAAELSAELAGRGIAIVSGGAYGIDGCAHRATLGVGGTTIAVMAGGVDRAYPAGHTDLFERVAATGAVISEVPCGGAPTKWRFLARNRVIAALGGATVVVEAGGRSGSLNTAGHAAALGRPIGAVPGPVTSASSVGCHRLLREFDARCVTDADEVVELLDPGTLFDDAALRVAGAGSGTPRTDDTTRVRDALSKRSRRGTEDIARRAGMSTNDVEVRLGLLLLVGEADRDADGWVLTATAP